MAGITIYALPGASQEFTLSNAPTGLVAANSIGFRILDDQGNTVVARTAVGCIETPAGSGHYAISLTVPTTLGSYSVLADTDPAGVATPTNSAVDTLIVTATLATQVVTASGAPTLGVCAQWLSGGEAQDFCMNTTGSIGSADWTTAAREATEVLFELSGRQFSGTCSSIVRPCIDSCTCWGNQSLALLGAQELGVPINWAGAGYWDCGGVQCGCGYLSEVVLDGYPIQTVTQVKIDGVAVAPSAYRLDYFRRLVRVDGSMWPVCQNLSAADTAQGTWSIAYTHGMDPPAIGKQAAAQLACEFFNAKAKSACSLPEAVQSVVRQGVSINKGSLASVVNLMLASPKGSGLVLVDAFLSAYNRAGLRRRPAVWSPDKPRYPRRTA